MHRLQSLSIKSYGYRCHASAAFDKLTLPALHELYLPGRFTPNAEPELEPRGWESLLSLLERSNCKLQAFKFGHGNIPDLIKNLESPLFEHLTSLQVALNFYAYSHNIFQLLDALSEVCEETQRPRMLPLLETLIFKSLHSEDDVREMVASVAAYGGCGKSKLRRVFTQRVEAGENALEMDLKDQE
ncbi:hypothetical protein H1R20_g15131, partial [Candolleomyces eurysporus]